MIIDYEDDKENLPNESDYEDLPSMYKDEDDDVDDDEDDDEDDDSIFTSKRHTGDMERISISAYSSAVIYFTLGRCNAGDLVWLCSSL